jgi:hypothetical protein
MSYLDPSSSSQNWSDCGYNANTSSPQPVSNGDCSAAALAVCILPKLCYDYATGKSLLSSAKTLAGLVAVQQCTLKYGPLYGIILAGGCSDLADRANGYLSSKTPSAQKLAGEANTLCSLYKLGAVSGAIGGFFVSTSLASKYFDLNEAISTIGLTSLGYLASSFVR